MLEQFSDRSKQCRNNVVATLCCAKNRRCESSRVTSPYLNCPSRGGVSLFAICSFLIKDLKTESIRKLSNVNFQWTKTLYQNNVKHIAFFLTFFKGYRCNELSVITPMTISHGSPRN